ncbi:MAG: FHA domain-containing protein, partial [Acidobacteria bacterium]|nr:FHA domain-containing protein [Acidobacteriota bacterium]
MTGIAIRLRPALEASHAPTISLARGESKTVGRSAQADIMIDEPSLSRLHARVTMTAAGTVRAEDLGSTNGMFVNGALQPAATLAVGDRVRFG